MHKQLLVAGGGIGGLAAALVCARAGWQPRVFERASCFSEIGAGVQLGPNAMRILHGWGLEKPLAGLAAFPDLLVVRSTVTGAEIGRLRLGNTLRARYGAPYATLHRADLHSLLLEAARSEPGVVLCEGAPVTAITASDDAVTLKTDSDQVVEGEALIGADGVWSTVRGHMLGGDMARPTGHLAYRALAVQAELPAALRSTQVTAWLGPRLHAITYPVRRGELLNVVLFAEGRIADPSGKQTDAAEVQGWDHAAVSADLQSASAGVCAPLRALLDALERWRAWPVYACAPLQNARDMARGCIALLGDAAHPMLPYLAQGAGMAIEDAAVLAQSLALCPELDVQEALQRYARLRWERVARVQACARRNGEIFHANGPVRVARDLAMRVLGEKLLDMPWLYGARV